MTPNTQNYPRTHRLAPQDQDLPHIVQICSSPSMPRTIQPHPMRYPWLKPEIWATVYLPQCTYPHNNVENSLVKGVSSSVQNILQIHRHSPVSQLPYHFQTFFQMQTYSKTLRIRHTDSTHMRFSPQCTHVLHNTQTLLEHTESHHNLTSPRNVNVWPTKHKSVRDNSQ